MNYIESRRPKVQKSAKVTWGKEAEFGGDSQAVRNQLQDVCSVAANNVAFAALLGDGSVVSWGKASGGGDSSGS